MKTQPTYTPQPMPTQEERQAVATHCDCGLELYDGDCPACDPWPEDDFDD